MIAHCGFSSLFYWANGLAPVQHHHAFLLTMVKTIGCQVCNTVPGCEVFLFMLANDAHVGAISLITTSVKTLVGPSPLHCPSHSTTPGEWVLVGWRLDWSVAAAQHVTEPRERVVVSDVQRLYLSTTRKCISSVSRSPWRRQCMETFPAHLPFVRGIHWWRWFSSERTDILCGFQLKVLTLNVRGPSYLGLTRSISWLLMTWLLTSPGHQQPWYWPCTICRFLSSLRKDFNYLRFINVEKWHKM